MRPLVLVKATAGSLGDIWTPTPDFPVEFLSTVVAKQDKQHKDLWQHATGKIFYNINST